MKMLRKLTFMGKLGEEPPEWIRWQNASNEEKMEAFYFINRFVFQEKDLIKIKVDRTIFSARKHEQ